MRSPAPSRRRLQRPPDFTGERLTRFREVLLRHGLPGLLLGILLLVLLPSGSALLMDGLAPAVADPWRYLAAVVLITLGIGAYVRRIMQGWHGPTLLWAGYLGLLSLWEEWGFRVALPAVFVDLGIAPIAGVVLANLLFGLLHYFTLRWRWPMCIAATLGGLALSRSYGLHGDLLLIAGLHWVGTFLNTPRLPSRG